MYRIPPKKVNSNELDLSDPGITYCTDCGSGSSS